MSKPSAIGNYFHVRVWNPVSYQQGWNPLKEGELDIQVNTDNIKYTSFTYRIENDGHVTETAPIAAKNFRCYIGNWNQPILVLVTPYIEGVPQTELAEYVPFNQFQITNPGTLALEVIRAQKMAAAIGKGYPTGQGVPIIPVYRGGFKIPCPMCLDPSGGGASSSCETCHGTGTADYSSHQIFMLQDGPPWGLITRSDYDLKYEEFGRHPNAPAYLSVVRLPIFTTGDFIITRDISGQQGFAVWVVKTNPATPLGGLLAIQDAIPVEMVAIADLSDAVLGQRYWIELAQRYL